MSYMSLEQIQNEFVIYRCTDSFILNRTVKESIDATDFIRMSEEIDRQIESVESQLKNLKEQKAKFEAWTPQAKLIKEENIEKSKKERELFMQKAREEQSLPKEQLKK